MDDIPRLPERRPSRSPQLRGLFVTRRAATRRAVDAESIGIDYLRMLRARPWVVVACTAVGVLAAIAHGLVVTPQYEAYAQLLLDPDLPRVVPFDVVVDEQATRADYSLTQHQILRSRTLARQTIDTLGLWGHPVLADPQPRSARLRAAFARMTGGVVSAAASPVPEEPRPDSAAEARTIGRFRQRLVIEPVRNSRLLNVRFSSPDPTLSANVVNTLVQAYVDRALQFSAESTEQALAWLDDRLARQRQVLEQSEAELQAFRAATGGLTGDGSGGVAGDRLAELNLAATQARADRISRESVHAQLLEALSAPTVDMAAGISSPAIERAREQVDARRAAVVRLSADLGDRHPDLVAARQAVATAEAQWRAEVERHVAVARQDLQTARAREQGLEAAVAAQQARVGDAERAAITYGVKQREVSSHQQMYDALLKRAQEAAVAGKLRTSNVRVVDHADVPLYPTSPRYRLNLAVASVAGLLLGLVAALLLGHLDDRLRTVADVARSLELPVLGVVPILPRDAVEGGLVSQDLRPFTDAMRAIRSQLAFECGSASPKVVVVTGTRRGEGKSMVAANLAAAIARTSARVLLVDADMRRPRQHLLFGCDRTPGLADVLATGTLAPGSVRQTALEHLALLPAGTPAGDVSERLGVGPDVVLLEAVGHRYDWILVDTPPVAETPDACLFAHGRGRIVFVVASGHVARADAQAAVDQLTQAGADLAGAILTRARPETSAYDAA